ncbi:MAG: zinc ribbon domain-containing protein [Deltaproteobacteria bacterium]|nr:zinc ribbon domain-containing protein [Deltaproteobacteria bacterium]
MPIYEYECRKCGRIIEAYQKFSDAPLKKCDKCSGKLQKLISHSTFHLKGTGWYVTDYANRSGGPRESTGGKDQSKPGGKARNAEQQTACAKKKKSAGSD